MGCGQNTPFEFLERNQEGKNDWTEKKSEFPASSPHIISRE